MELRRAKMAPKEPFARRESDYADIVIIGNGIAGMTAAIEARRLAPELTISIITDQSHPTIYKPALKQLISGVLTPRQMLAYPPGTESKSRLTMIHSHVEYINTAKHELHLSDGSYYSYGSLLIATGSQPVTTFSRHSASDLDGVITLHRLRDYLDLSRRLNVSGEGKVKEVVVIGGGIQACETVTNLLDRGLAVHWLIRSGTFYSKMLDQRASDLLLGHIQNKGARIWLHTEVAGIVGKLGSVTGVVTNRNSFIPCQLVIMSMGVQPVLELTKQMDRPLTTGPGIIVDDYLQTSIPDIYAAGDAAAIWNPITNKHELRAQWAAAVQQGQIAATAITGHQEQIENPLGAFWHSTKVGDFSLLIIGAPLLDQGTEALFSMVDGTYRRVTIANKRLVGFFSLGTELMDGLGIKRLIDEGLDSSEMIQALLTGTFDPQSYTKLYHTVKLLASSQLSRDQETETTVSAEQIIKSALPHPPLAQPLVEKVRGVSALSLYTLGTQIAKEVQSCIGCSECLLVCPAVAEPLTIDVLNKETLNGPYSDKVTRFAHSCYQCGACVPVCPVGLHRDAMMMWLKIRLQQSEQKEVEQMQSEQKQISEEVPYAAR